MFEIVKIEILIKAAILLSIPLISLPQRATASIYRSLNSVELSQDQVAVSLKPLEKRLEQIEEAESQINRSYIVNSRYGVNNATNSDPSIDSCVSVSSSKEVQEQTCKENVLSNMCQLEVSAKEYTERAKYCKQYFNEAARNQNIYDSKGQFSSSKEICLNAASGRSDLQIRLKEEFQLLVEACKRALLMFEEDTQLLDSDIEILLSNVNFVLNLDSNTSEAYVFFSDLLDKWTQIEREGKIEDYVKEDIRHNVLYPIQVYMGDINFLEKKYEKALKNYKNANKIYERYKRDNEDFPIPFISEFKPAGGVIDPTTLTRLSSFIGSFTRTAFILNKKGMKTEARQSLEEAIKELETASSGQVLRTHSLEIQEIGSPLYSLKQSLLIEDGKYGEALEYADRSRSVVYLDNFYSLASDTEKKMIRMEDIKKLARQQSSTIVAYSIPDLVIPNYEKLKTLSDSLYIWLIKPDGELIFKEVNLSDESSPTSKDGFHISFIDANALTVIIFGALVLAVSLYGVRYKKYVFLVCTLAFLGVVYSFSIASISGRNKSLVRGTNNYQDNSISNLIFGTVQTLETRGEKSNEFVAQSCHRDDTCLKSLYRYLIAPIASHLPKLPEDNIIFVPHRSLNYTPFSALIDGKGKYLIESHTIRSVSSLHVLRSLIRRSSETIRSGDDYLIVGNPKMPDLSNVYPSRNTNQLPYAEDEANEIAKIYQTNSLTGESASIDAVRSRLGSAKIIHLATHGYLEGADYGTASLLFSPSPGEEPQTGLLDTSDLYITRLVAELAVLSACESALGYNTVEGNLSLTRPFHIAGVPTVVSSLWLVNDEATSKLMISFYKYLENTSDKALALRQAMLDVKNTNTHSDPMFWAAFRLSGLSKLPKAQPQAQRIIGEMACGNVSGGNDYNANTSDLSAARLEVAPNGYTLYLTKTSKDIMRLELDNNLVVREASSGDSDSGEGWLPWNLVAYQGDPWEIEENGNFSMDFMYVSTRSVCSFKGKLEFSDGAKAKLF